MKKNETSSEMFEDISKSIVEYLLQGTNASIKPTRPVKDGGYDIIVEYHDGYSMKRAFFECKLRKGNLNLRDIAANVIIAFNHGAVALVAVTNHDFTQQTGEEVLDFCKHTILNVKIIIGEEIQQILPKCGITVEDELYNYLNVKKTRRKDEFKALRINFNEDILHQIFPQKQNQQIENNSAIDELFSNEIKRISSGADRGALIAVTGYLGVGKHQIIQSALSKTNKHIITVDATLYETKDLVILDILAQIWGISSIDMFALFSQNDIRAIAKMVGNENNAEETVEILTAMLNKNYADKRATARQNVLLSKYIVELLTLHAEDIGYVLYIRKLQFASVEIYDFLIYFSKHLTTASIGCVISYQKPEYALQSGRQLLDNLKCEEKYEECPIELLNNDQAYSYIEMTYPGVPSYIAQLIISRAGTRIYNLSYLLKYLFPAGCGCILPIDSRKIMHNLQLCTPNSVPNLLEQSLPQYKKTYAALFETCYLFECRVPIDICLLFDYSTEDFDDMMKIGIFQCNQNILIAQNEFVEDWIMNTYSDNSPSICLRAKKILNLVNSGDLVRDIGYINIYRVLGYNTEALSLLEKELTILKKEKQYTCLRKGLTRALEVAKTSYNYEKEIHYLIELLDIMTIQKEITSDRAEEYIARLEYYLKRKNLQEDAVYALSFFKIKRAFKLGKYIIKTDNTIQTGQEYYEACLHKKYQTIQVTGLEEYVVVMLC